MVRYFQLQYNMFNRRLIEFGLIPIIGIILIVIGFIGGSIYLFFKTDLAPYIYVLVSISLVTPLSETRRNMFLKSTFGNTRYLKLRLLENTIVSLPFMVFLVTKGFFFVAIVLMVLILFLAAINLNGKNSFVIPTPFYAKPFEFTVGIRKTYFVVLLAYLTTIISIYVDNFNLGAFSLILVFLIILTYYSKPEEKYYVWSHSSSPKQFIFEKIKIGVYYSTLTVLPIIVSLVIYYGTVSLPLLIISLLGYTYLITIILAKYSAYPSEMNLLHTILIGFSFIFPPILLGVIPYFYIRSISQLNDILK